MYAVRRNGGQSSGTNGDAASYGVRERRVCIAVGNGLEVRAVVSKQDSTIGLSVVFMAALPCT